MTFDELYETYFADVFRFALWLSRDQTEAEDIASETFVRAWGHRHRLRTETLKGYLLAIARNLFLDLRRKGKGRDDLDEEIPDGAPDPHRQTAARLDLDRIRQLLTRFPESDRIALVLRSEQALSYAEIARVLEISEGSARVKVHRVRRRLLDALLQPQGGR